MPRYMWAMYLKIKSNKMQLEKEKTADFRNKIKEKHEDILWKITDPKTNKIQHIEAPLPSTLVLRLNSNNEQ